MKYSSIISNCDLELLKNERIISLSKHDFSKAIAPSNEYIQQKILQSMLDESVLMVNNKPYDLLIDGRVRIQSKLRQVKGITPFSASTYLETTRRHSIQNIDKSKTGHVCYGSNEFDFLFITLIHSKINRTDVDMWKFCLIPVAELIDPKNESCLLTSIPAKILQKYSIEEQNMYDLLAHYIQSSTKFNPTEPPEI